MRHSRIYRGIFLAVLLACTVYLIYTIIRRSGRQLRTGLYTPGLGVTAGFIVLDRQKRKKLKAKEL